MLISPFLFSCASTRLRMLENSGAIRADFSEDHDYDYIVIMEGVSYLGWNGNNKEDRRGMLLSMFGDRCKELKIGDETLVKAGSTQSNTSAPTWAMKVKCIN